MDKMKYLICWRAICSKETKKYLFKDKIAWLFKNKIGITVILMHLFIIYYKKAELIVG